MPLALLFDIKPIERSTGILFVLHAGLGRHFSRVVHAVMLFMMLPVLHGHFVLVPLSHRRLFAFAGLGHLTRLV